MPELVTRCPNPLPPGVTSSSFLTPKMPSSVWFWITIPRIFPRNLIYKDWSRRIDEEHRIIYAVDEIQTSYLAGNLNLHSMRHHGTLDK
ncbi:MAG: hypothetical protein EPN21_19135 [Methylococcaceae bacterium]|nr:MAG: hypothetical protein EPN21_19135 [Methylococcaceae bacterium]